MGASELGPLEVQARLPLNLMRMFPAMLSALRTLY